MGLLGNWNHAFAENSVSWGGCVVKTGADERLRVVDHVIHLHFCCERPGSLCSDPDTAGTSAEALIRELRCFAAAGCGLLLAKHSKQFGIGLGSFSFLIGRSLSRGA